MIQLGKVRERLFTLKLYCRLLTLKSDMETFSMEPATFEGSSKDFIEGPSLHSIQKEANAEAWKKIRPRMQLLNMKPCKPISYAFCALLNWLYSNAENVVRLLFFAIAASIIKLLYFTLQRSGRLVYA